MRWWAGAALLLAIALVTGGARAGDQGTVAGWVYVNPLELELSFSAGQVKAGQAARARSMVTNRGSADLANVVVTLRVDPTGLTIAGSTRRTIALLEGGATAEVTWRICGTQPGSYVLLTHGEFTRPTGQLVATDSAAYLLQVLPNPRAKCPR